ncbi:MAG: hypothetical protein R3349_02415 [Geminicoccaceae bacterium]|nr:hypothetical protein [Geminicoccaceae bacterium]
MVRAWVAALSEFAITGGRSRQGLRRTGRPPVSVEAIRRRSDAYARSGIEPALEDVLCDPIIQLVMRSDRLDPDHLPATPHRTVPSQVEH